MHIIEQRGVDMFDVFIKSVITFLVVYSIIDIFLKLLKIFDVKNCTKEMFVFIHVKNQEESIEYIVRNTIFQYLNKFGGRQVPYVVIVDKGSEDKTSEIAKKLCDDYDFLYYTTIDKYLEFKNQIGH